MGSELCHLHCARPESLNRWQIYLLDVYPIHTQTDVTCAGSPDTSVPQWGLPMGIWKYTWHHLVKLCLELSTSEKRGKYRQIH